MLQDIGDDEEGKSHHAEQKKFEVRPVLECIEDSDQDKVEACCKEDTKGDSPGCDHPLCFRS